MHMVSALLIISASILSPFMSNCSGEGRENAPLAQSLPVMGKKRMTKQKVFRRAQKNGWVECTGTGPMTVGKMKEIYGMKEGINPELVRLSPEPNEYGVIDLPDCFSVDFLKEKYGIVVFGVNKYRDYHTNCYRHPSCREYAKKRKSCEF